MKVFLFKHIKHRPGIRFSTGLFPGSTFLCVLLFLSSCAPANLHPVMSAGEPKNSLPFFDKDLIEELHSIAVPPFLGDQYNWRETAVEVLSLSKRMSVIPSGKTNDALKNSRRDLSSLRPEERLAFIAKLGRTMRADAVMNGVILNKQGQLEIILQVVSSRDSRVIWWQAVDVNFKEGSTLSRPGEQKVLSSLLSPFLALVGKREAQPKPQMKQGTGPQSALCPQTEGPSGTETQPSIKRAQRSYKKTNKTQKPLQLPEDISPM